jgi:hypothetical protein
MLAKFLGVCCVAGLLGLFATPTPAYELSSPVNVALACTQYTIDVTAGDLVPGVSYQIQYTFTLSSTTGGPPLTISDTIPFTAQSTSFTDAVTKPLSLTDNYNASSGTASLVFSNSGQTINTVQITFSPTSVHCSPPPPPLCQASTSNVSNFNGTPIAAGNYIWFNANFTANGVPTTGATVTFTNSTITFKTSTASFNLPVPNAQITFSPSVSCVSTTFDSLNNRFVTTAPIGGSDEIFLTALSFLVPANFGQVSGNVTWNGTFGTNSPNVTMNWKWAAAVYTSPCFVTDYNIIAPLAAHGNACVGSEGGDHAGTPEGTSPNTGKLFKACVIGGARGGGGSNFTGSLSGTVGVRPVCQ